MLNTEGPSTIMATIVWLRVWETIVKKAIPLILLLASAAQGEIYTWTDGQGTAHYTNSLVEVPARYRKRAKTLNIGVEPKSDQAQIPANGQAQVARPQGQNSQVSPNPGVQPSLSGPPPVLPGQGDGPFRHVKERKRRSGAHNMEE